MSALARNPRERQIQLPQPGSVIIPVRMGGARITCGEWMGRRGRAACWCGQERDDGYVLAAVRVAVCGCRLRGCAASLGGAFGVAWRGLASAAAFPGRRRERFLEQ